MDTWQAIATLVVAAVIYKCYIFCQMRYWDNSKAYQELEIDEDRGYTVLNNRPEESSGLIELHDANGVHLPLADQVAYR